MSRFDRFPAPSVLAKGGFAEAQHPRDDHGRFRDDGRAPSFSQAPLRESSPGPQRRSLTRGEGWQRVGAKIARIPVAYTGSANREQPVDGWSMMAVQWQAPKAVPVDDHMALLGKLKQMIKDKRAAITDKAKVTRQWVAVHGYRDRYTLKRRTGDLYLDPETPSGTANRAYNHAAMLALHDFGVLDYDFKMSEPLKAELTPATAFIRYARRSLGQQMKAEHRGAWRPYREEFGQRFPNPKFDRLTGAERKRVRPNQQLIKAWGDPGDAERRLSALQARRDPGGIEARKATLGRFLTEAEVRAAARSVQVPTPGQRDAGNYQKGHLRIGGLAIAIETPKGRVRRGVGPMGRPWSVRMPAHYGYVKRTEGADGDHLDVYLGPQAHEAELHPVYVVDQVDARSRAFDEHKAMLGFPTRADALATYDAGFSDGRGPRRRGAVTTMSFAQFRRWAMGGDTTQPLALAKAFGQPASMHAGMHAGQQAPGVLAPQPGLSRWDRYRAAIARNESQGRKSFAPLSPQQRQERVSAARDFKMKRQSGAPMPMAGMPGSIANLGLPKTPSLRPPRAGGVPSAFKP